MIIYIIIFLLLLFHCSQQEGMRDFDSMYQSPAPSSPPTSQQIQEAHPLKTVKLKVKDGPPPGIINPYKVGNQLNGYPLF